MFAGLGITKIQFIHTLAIYQSGKSNNSMFNIVFTVGFVGNNHQKSGSILGWSETGKVADLRRPGFDRSI
jgi:hypothetical protein